MARDFRSFDNDDDDDDDSSFTTLEKTTLSVFINKVLIMQVKFGSVPMNRIPCPVRVRSVAQWLCRYHHVIIVLQSSCR